ncbi:penicillin-binding protein 1C [Candidatus Peregrinibacteria bacterium]|nr:penicillin-binding protein 1C [Candidatus Peregrinibacteria bacterium]
MRFRFSKNQKWWLLLPLFLLFLFGVWFFLWPLPGALRQSLNHSPVKLLDRNGALLYEVRSADFGGQEYKPLAGIPKELILIVLATEDRSFAQHPGISLKGILRAAWQNFTSGNVVSGGSTITQQLVRLRLQPKERGYAYKLKEILLALKLERVANKSKILEDYLNNIYLGHQAYGVQAGATIYFNKNISELSLAETALLVGLIQSPASYDPFAHFALAKKRQKVVLKSMEDVGMITAEEAKELQQEPIRLGHGKIKIRAPHFVMWMRSMVRPQNFAARQGASTEIRTTLDLSLQSETERIVDYQLEKLKDKNVTSAAVVVLDARQGDVLAMVGSGDYFDADHDGAFNAAISPRQPGSALKPFTYALALRSGDTAASTAADVETRFFTQEGNPYSPRNFDYGYHGLVRYREALANSYNIAAVKVLQKVGVDSLLKFLRAAGLTTLNKTPEHYGLALTLGDAEVSLLELTQAYGVFARGGVTMPIRTLLDQPIAPGEPILDSKIAWLISDILSDPQARLPEFGESSALDFDFPVAAKTGTTRNSRDNWTLGYTPDFVVGVWVGNADNTPMKNTSGVTGAGPIFHDVLLAAVKNHPRTDFIQPRGLVKKEICRLSGKLPTPECRETIPEWFIQRTEPKTPDDIFIRVKTDRRNDLLAEPDCPAQYIEEKVFTLFPPEVRTWARENGYKEPPVNFSPLCPQGAVATTQSQGEDWVSIQKPHANESFLLDPLIPAKNQKIILEAEAGKNATTIDWFIDDKKIGSAKAPNYRLEWPPVIGRFRVEAKAPKSQDKVTIEILNQK